MTCQIRIRIFSNLAQSINTNFNLLISTFYPRRDNFTLKKMLTWVKELLCTYIFKLAKRIYTKVRDNIRLSFQSMLIEYLE